MAFDYLLNLNNPNYRVIIAGLDGGPVTGTLINEMPIAGGNQFSSAKEITESIPIVGKAISVKDKASNLVNISGRSSLTEAETRLVWTGSSKPQFTIDLYFYQISADQTPSTTDIMKRVQSSVLPSKSGVFFKAPLGYKINGSGTLALSIGRWFRATNLVTINTNLVPSKEVNVNGIPLVVSGSVTLEPFRGITFKEFSDYFRA